MDPWFLERARKIGRIQALDLRYAKAWGLVGSVLKSGLYTDEERGKLAAEIYKAVEEESRITDQSWKAPRP